MDLQQRGLEALQHAQDVRADPQSQEYKQWATAMQAYYKNQPTAAHASTPYYATQMSPAYANIWGGQQAQMMSPYTASPFYPGSVYPGAQPPPYAAYSVPGPGQHGGVQGAEAVYARSAAKDPQEAAVAVAAAERNVAIGGTGMGGDVHGGGVPSSSEAPQMTQELIIPGRGPEPSGPSTNSTLTNQQEYWRRQQVTAQITATPGGAAVDYNQASASLVDEREAKRQRRKQSNRESARRSRLRKQSECDELANKVNSMAPENRQLRTDCANALASFNALLKESEAMREQLKAAGLELPPATVVPPAQIDLERVLATPLPQAAVVSKAEPESDHDEFSGEERNVPADKSLGAL